jgi:hypothetical protein
MGLVSKTIPGFYNGVSQQASVLRLETQLEMQVNAMSSLVLGLYKRPGSEHLALLSSGAATGAFIHKIRRGSEKYLVVFTTSATEPIEVFDFAGNKCTVQYGALDASLNFTSDIGARDYITYGSAAPNVRYRAVTIADHTIIVNTEKTVAWPSPSGQTGGTLKGTKQGFSALPTTGNTTGDVWEISGDVSNKFDNYYVTYTGTNVWIESVKPGIPAYLDKKTLPHRLVRTGASTFTFAPCLWASRLVGDEVSNLTPSFYGKTINNVFFFKNRLGFLCGDNVLLSESGQYFNFWRTSVLDYLDSDPIDKAVADKEVTTLRSAVVFNQAAILFGDKVQFEMSSGDSPLTPKTASITPTTRFEITLNSDPVPSGTSIFFPSPRSNYSSVREYIANTTTTVDDAADITAHCPSYIPNGTIQMEACAALDTIFLLTSAESNSLFVYKYYWVGDEKPQSSWSKFTFGGQVLGTAVIESCLYLVVKYPNTVALERMELSNINTGSLGFRIHLDRLKQITGTYSAGTNRTTWTLIDSDTSRAFSAIHPTTGLEVKLTSVGDGTAYAVGNYGGVNYYIGTNYEYRNRLSEWHLRDSNKAAITEGRLQIRNLSLSFKDTGYFQVEVTPFMRDTDVLTSTEQSTGALVGVTRLGQVPLLSGINKFMVLAKSQNTKVDIVSASYLPVFILTGGWEGLYHARSKSI